MIGSCILEHRSNYSFDIVTSMGMPTSSITCHTLFVSHPLMGTILIQKPKATKPHPRKHRLSVENHMMSVSYTMSSYPHTSGGNLLTQKIPQWSLHDPHNLNKSIYNPHLTPIWPPHPQEGLKTPKKSQNSSHRGWSLQKGDKTPQRSLRPPKELNIKWKGIKSQKRG